MVNSTCIDKDRTTGKITAVWPGSSNHFMELIESPRYEDFEIQYINVKPPDRLHLDELISLTFRRPTPSGSWAMASRSERRKSKT
jgi:hypothetical protein